MKIVNVVQGSPEWLEYRKMKICASDIASIMGMNPFKSPWKCYQEKTGSYTPFVSDAMRRGVELEPVARARINEVLEEHYAPLCIEHEIGWMFASLDGYSAKAQVPIIEIKCPGVETHRIACDDKVPHMYYPQLQFQMYVADVDCAYYCSYMPEDLTPLAIVLVKRDDEFCERMSKEAAAFFLCLLQFDPPERSEKDKEPRKIEDVSWVKIAQERINLSKNIALLESQRDEIDKAIKDFCDGETCIMGSLKITKSERKGSIDYDAIPELKGVDKEKYRKPNSEMWSIREI